MNRIIRLLRSRFGIKQTSELLYNSCTRKKHYCSDPPIILNKVFNEFHEKIKKKVIPRKCFIYQLDLLLEVESNGDRNLG